MSEKNAKMDKDTDSNVEKPASENHTDSLLDESMNDNTFTREDDENESSVQENDDQNASNQAAKEKGEQINGSNDDLMIDLFKKMEVLYDPKNASLFFTSQNLEVQDYKRQLEARKQEISDLYETNKKIQLEKQKLKMENRDLSKS